MFWKPLAIQRMTGMKTSAEIAAVENTPMYSADMMPPFPRTRTSCVPMIEAMIEMPPRTSGMATPRAPSPAGRASSMPATSVTA